MGLMLSGNPGSLWKSGSGGEAMLGTKTDLKYVTFFFSFFSLKMRSMVNY